MKKVVLYFFIVLMATALSILLVDSILQAGDATVMQALLIANLISISVAITGYANVSDPGNTVHHFHPVSPITRPGMIKKGDKLTPEHRAKISASLKKRAAYKKEQEERIQKTRASKIARKKSGK